MNHPEHHLIEILITTLIENRTYLSELDAATGDGDHGINLAKGFKLVKQKLEGTEVTLSEGFKIISQTLHEEIGGSMGPIYGAMFSAFSDVTQNITTFNETILLEMLEKGLVQISRITPAAIGDKTLLDVYIPALLELRNAQSNDQNDGIDRMLQSAERGFEYTATIPATFGRASRLQEKTIGYKDPGAASCLIILQLIGNFFKDRNEENDEKNNQ